MEIWIIVGVYFLFMPVSIAIHERLDSFILDDPEPFVLFVCFLWPIVLPLTLAYHLTKKALDKWT